MRIGSGSSPFFPPGGGRGTRDDAADFPDVPQAVARLFEAAAGPATEEELSGEPAIVAAFVLAVNAAGPRSGKQGRFPDGRRPSRRVPVLVAGIAMAVGAAIGGTATADALPPRIQEIAHTAFGAPAPHHHGDGVPAPTPRHSPRVRKPSPSPAGTYRHGDGDPRATAKASPGTVGPEHLRPGKAGLSKPGKAISRGKANGHLKAHGARTHPKKASQGRKNDHQQAGAASAQGKGRGHQKSH
jgi:hypothetical protein